VIADFLTGLSIGGVAGAFVVLLGLAGLAWWFWRSVKRRIQRARWFLQRGVLHVRAVVLPMGPRREIARMRLSLHDNVAQTQRVLSHRAAIDNLPRNLRDLLPQLELVAARLDAQLRLWQTEPDLALVRGALPGLLDRGDTIIAHAVALRASALPLIDEADQLSRSAAEDDLRGQLQRLDAGFGTTARLQAPSTLNDSPLRPEEAARRR
jgi:hypothetical protein